MAACEITFTQNLFVKVQNLILCRVLLKAGTTVELETGLQGIGSLSDKHPAAQVVEAHSFKSKLNCTLTSYLAQEVFL